MAVRCRVSARIITGLHVAQAKVQGLEIPDRVHSASRGFEHSPHEHEAACCLCLA